jgi:hypothetical protein
MNPADVNFLAVLIATAVAVGIGALWYSPVLFAAQWMEAIGKTPEQMGNPTQAMSLAPFNTLVTAFILALLINELELNSLVQGALFGALMWASFSLTTHIYSMLFEGRSQKLILIDGGHLLTVYTVMGAIVGVWP